MSKLGRIKNGRMTHMIVTNKKLKKRKKDMEKINENISNRAAGFIGMHVCKNFSWNFLW